MLKASNIRTTVSQPYICLRCSAKLHSGYGYRSRSLVEKHSQLLAPQHRTAERIVKKGARNFSCNGSIQNAEVATIYTPSLPPPEKPPPPNIRQRLYEWELAHGISFELPRALIEKVEPGGVFNNTSRTNDGDHRIELNQDETDDDASMVTYDDLVDVGERRGFLVSGDLVELRSVVGGAEELAIYVRDVESQSQFYTMSGKWIHRSSQFAHFFVPQFVDPKELDEILPYLPTSDVSSSQRDMLQDFPLSVPRDLGKPLLRKMLDFWAASDAEYQASSSSLGNAHEIVAHNCFFSYATLEEITQKVLPSITSETECGTFSPHLLYAVHRSLFRDDIGFRPQKHGTLRTGGQYEISPLKEARIVRWACDEVRKHRFEEARKISGILPHAASNLEKFAIKMRRLIDRSRKTHPFSVYGTILPSEPQEAKSYEDETIEPRQAVDGASGQFLLFLESWVALSSFGYSSFLNGIGSEILRATQRYGEVNLDKTTAWTFLQEVGEIAPWENRIPFDLKLPGVGRRLDEIRLPNEPPNASLKDSLKSLRQNWDDLPVFCIDDPGAHEIDDGISIEATDTRDEYWIHVHAADPSSRLRVDGGIAKFAESFIENVYMPEQAYSILPSSTVRAHFSLAQGRPSMTFSARMNKSGHIIDSKITPGIINNVLFLSPATLQQVVLGTPPPSADTGVLRVTGPAAPGLPKDSYQRIMLESRELSTSATSDLQLLHEIGAAHAANLRERGGVDQNFPPKPKLSVQAPGKSGGAYDGLPSIALSTMEVATETNPPSDQGNLVQSFMLVAAQVAAKFCSDRGVPVPYRVTPRNPTKEDPADFFIREVLPSRAETGVAPIEITLEYLRLIGGVLPSIIPGPHAAVGVDMMVRCTSPLRRFTDLLVHWQIGATLLEEARLGHSLVGNTRDDFLPFSKARVEALLPRIDTREKLVKHGHKEADRQWLCLFLLRAWQFKETELPPTLPFLVRRISIDERKIFGMLTGFSTRAQCSVPDEMDLEEIQIGQTIQVELEHINVYERKIQVKVG